MFDMFGKKNNGPDRSNEEKGMEEFRDRLSYLITENDKLYESLLGPAKISIFAINDITDGKNEKSSNLPYIQQLAREVGSVLWSISKYSSGSISNHELTVKGKRVEGLTKERYTDTLNFFVDEMERDNGYRDIVRILNKRGVFDSMLGAYLVFGVPEAGYVDIIASIGSCPPGFKERESGLVEPSDDIITPNGKGCGKSDIGADIEFLDEEQNGDAQ